MCVENVDVPLSLGVFFFFKQKTAYEMRMIDWSSDVCSSDLVLAERYAGRGDRHRARPGPVEVWTFDDDGVASPTWSASGQDRKRVVEGKSVSVRVDHGGRRIINKQKYTL